ncbi:unnamed protein product [Eruca vesicaria subsp. sativa]|uniref:Uncharacterized protein n=1 Tax=Eruca vesicaria subsp. sativa TaxID=29727 RepID=A0ABC8M1R2_ERUVS|nr:unnamed protein product [Eruca vesicaria subsp. sativa]
MNCATKFLVMILFIGVACADVDARKLAKVSKELMDQKPFLLQPMPLTVPESGEIVSAAKGVENEVVTVSKGTKLEISIPKNVATNGIGSELVLTVRSSATRVISANDNAAEGPGGPRSGATGRTTVSTYGIVVADGPNPSAYSTSIAGRQADADAEAGPGSATGSGSSSGYAYTISGGSIGNGRS